MKGYDEFNTILLPPRTTGEKLPAELTEYYEEQMKKLEEAEKARREAEEAAEQAQREQEEKEGKTNTPTKSLKEVFCSNKHTRNLLLIRFDPNIDVLPLDDVPC